MRNYPQFSIRVVACILRRSFVKLYIDKNVNESTTVCSLRALSLGLYAIYKSRYTRAKHDWQMIINRIKAIITIFYNLVVGNEVI